MNDSLLAVSIENLPIGYIVAGSDRKLTTVNGAALKLLGVKTLTTLEQVASRLPEKIALLDHVTYCSLDHKSCNFRELDVDGKILRVFLSPLFNGGELAGSIVTLEDVTEVRAKERAREQFMALLVHELRTPLTVIRGNSQLIDDHCVDGTCNTEMHELVSDIDHEAEFLLESVNTFLDLSRLEAGRVPYELQEFDAAKVVRAAVHSLKVLTDERGLELKFIDSEAKIPNVIGDPARMRQVLVNLLGNAVKYTPKGHIAVSLRTEGDNMVITVADTGQGIPAEAQHELFDKYYQATNNQLRHDPARGTGLGLYVSKLIMTGMGGRVWLAQSKLGQGSAFSFALPVSTPAGVKQMNKTLYDAGQGVEHTPATG